MLSFSIEVLTCSVTKVMWTFLDPPSEYAMVGSAVIGTVSQEPKGS